MSGPGNGVVGHGGWSYVAGWFDGSIGQFLGNLPGSSGIVTHALVTSLDSDPVPFKMLRTSPALKPLSADAERVGDGFLVPSAVLLEHREAIFSGFDEVWFFPHGKVAPKPKGVGLVGPNRVDQRKLDRLDGWLTANDCSLALGDGGGLNVVVKARGLVRSLLAFSTLQPQPTTGGEEERVKEAV